jgi:hypothetical protein
MRLTPRTLPVLTAALFVVFGAPALGQDAPEPPPAGGAVPAPVTTPSSPAKPPETVPPPLAGARGGVDINFAEQDLYSLLEYFARATGRNFIIGDKRDLEGKKITILSNAKVSPEAAYEAFLSALEVHGLTTIKVGDLYKIVKSQDAQQSPGEIRDSDSGRPRPTDNYITQIITLSNVSVTDIRQIVDNLVSPNAKVLAYAPTNSLILTDSGNNVRRIYDLVTKLDIAAPKSSMLIYPVVFADAAELKQLIEELYGTVEDTSSTSTRGRTAATPARPSRARRDEPAAPAGGGHSWQGVAVHHQGAVRRAHQQPDRSGERRGASGGPRPHREDRHRRRSHQPLADLRLPAGAREGRRHLEGAAGSVAGQEDGRKGGRPDEPEQPGVGGSGPRG